jgi:CRISPR/Cas system Type II protein with McrA/HNH and RuvC-like nuclease domain
MGYLKEHTCNRCSNLFWARNPRASFCKLCAPIIALQERESSDKAKYTIFLRDEFKCVYCGSSSIEDGVRLVLDHIIAYTETHDNSLYNLITACNDCNMTKRRNKLPIEIYNRIVARNIERNKGISPEKQEDVNVVLNEYFEKQKNK